MNLMLSYYWSFCYNLIKFRHINMLQIVFVEYIFQLGGHVTYLLHILFIK